MTSSACTATPFRVLRCERCDPDFPAQAGSSLPCHTGSDAAGAAADGVVGRDLPLADSPNELLRGLESSIPKILNDFPFLEDVDLVGSMGRSCATSSAVAVGPVLGTVICSGLFERVLLEVGMGDVVPDKGREGDLVIGREGPATGASMSGSRLEWRACKRSEAVCRVVGIGSTIASSERERRFFERERDRERLKKLTICAGGTRKAMLRKHGKPPSAPIGEETRAGYTHPCTEPSPRSLFGWVLHALPFVYSVCGELDIVRIHATLVLGIFRLEDNVPQHKRQSMPQRCNKSRSEMQRT